MDSAASAAPCGPSAPYDRKLGVASGIERLYWRRGAAADAIPCSSSSGGPRGAGPTISIERRKSCVLSGP